jgi:hypothetical protein
MIARELDGKMRVTSGSWEGAKVFARSEVLEVRNVDGRLHVARKPRHHDEMGPADRAVRSRNRAIKASIVFWMLIKVISV